MEKFHREEINDFCYLTVLLGLKKAKEHEKGEDTSTYGTERTKCFWFKTEIPGGNL